MLQRTTNTLAPVERDANAHPERRDAVLKAARKVFESKGLDGASIRLIAKAARGTTGSIYPYFKGKEEIYAELLSQSLDSYNNQLVAAIENAAGTKSRFEAAVMSYFDYYEKRPSDMSLALYLFNGLKPQGLTHELDTRLNEQLVAILGIFNECVLALACCSKREAEIEVGQHFAMLLGLLTLYHTKRTRVFRVDARELLKLHIRRSIERLSS